MKFQPRKTISEAMVQAEFYQACKESGLKCFLEYSAKLNGLQRCQFDAIVHDGHNIIALIEIKAYKRSTMDKRARWRNSKQATKYLQFGIPFFILFSFDDIPSVVKRIVSMRGKGVGG